MYVYMHVCKRFAYGDCANKISITVPAYTPSWVVLSGSGSRCPGEAGSAELKYFEDGGLWDDGKEVSLRHVYLAKTDAIDDDCAPGEWLCWRGGGW